MDVIQIDVFIRQLGIPRISRVLPQKNTVEICLREKEIKGVPVKFYILFIVWVGCDRGDTSSGHCVMEKILPQQLISRKS